MYRRADLSRIMTFVVPLFLTAASVDALSREFRASESGVCFQNSSAPSFADNVRPIHAIANVNDLALTRDRAADRTNPQGASN